MSGTQEQQQGAGQAQVLNQTHARGLLRAPNRFLAPLTSMSCAIYLSVPDPCPWRHCSPPPPAPPPPLCIFSFLQAEQQQQGSESQHRMMLIQVSRVSCCCCSNAGWQQGSGLVPRSPSSGPCALPSPAPSSHPSPTLQVSEEEWAVVMLDASGQVKELQIDEATAKQVQAGTLTPDQLAAMLAAQQSGGGGGGGDEAS